MKFRFCHRYIRNFHGKGTFVRSSHAEELGVKRGWKLRKIGDEDVEGKDSEYVYEALYEEGSGWCRAFHMKK